MSFPASRASRATVRLGKRLSVGSYHFFTASTPSESLTMTWPSRQGANSGSAVTRPMPTGSKLMGRVKGSMLPWNPR